MTWLACALLIVSSCALIAGLRGRAKGDHPTCRRCGYDLFGLGLNTHQCPECGTDLLRKRSIRTGTRRRNSGLVMAAAPVWLASLGWLSEASWTAAQHIQTEHYKPVGWVAHDAKSSDVTLRETAVSELVARLDRGELSRAQVTALVDQALNAQASSNLWIAYWGDFIEKASAAGGLSDQQWQLYWEQAFSFSLFAPQSITADQPLIVEIGCGDPLLSGKYSGCDVEVSYRGTRLLINDMPFDPSCLGERTFQMTPRGVHSGFTPACAFSLPSRILDVAPGGRANIVADAQVDVFIDNPRPSAHFTKQLTAKVVLVPRPGPAETQF